MRRDPWRKHLQQLVTLSGVKSDGQQLNPLHLDHVQWFRASGHTTLLSSPRKSTPHLVVFCFFMSVTRCILSTCRNVRNETKSLCSGFCYYSSLYIHNVSSFQGHFLYFPYSPKAW
ncbi:hypothetical protein TNIN_302661 [Trichonephila inaurata madagascariensis]|uniref:Uncharacterized protein n=1 Tax=Trichonephila inaurata madagascariensis TaxID=2747483 RepID=A0A8X6WUI9_9ARAC|nr:hypothetical protein TNIN_302661 [Trichonephila inaurata madagascariensis]